MKFTRVLYVSVLAGAVLLSSTGCGFLSDEEKKEPSEITTTAKAKPTSTDTAVRTEQPTSNPTSTDLTIVDDGTQSLDDSSSTGVDLELGSENDPMIVGDYGDDPAPASYGEEGWESNAGEKFVADGSETAQAARVVGSLNNFYGYVLNPATFDQVSSIGQQISGEIEVPEIQYMKFAQDNASIFRHFDTSNGSNVRNAYLHLLSSSVIGKKIPGVSITIPVEAVVVYGDTASVDLTRAVVIKDGVDYSSQIQAGASVELVKLDTGAWVMVAPSA